MHIAHLGYGLWGRGYERIEMERLEEIRCNRLRQIETHCTAPSFVKLDLS